MSPTFSLLAEEGRVSDSTIDFYAARARGGAGALVVEAVAVDSVSAARPGQLMAREDALPGLRRLASAVKTHDSAILGQLYHIGGSHLLGYNRRPVGPSAVPDPFSGEIPHVLSVDEIARIVADFCKGALLLRAAGFDGAEIHAAHGHLLSLFLSPAVNVRTDRYGLTTVGRARIVAEILQTVRQHCGLGFVLGLRMPGDDGVSGGVGPPEAERIVGHLRRTVRFDYVCFSQGANGPSLGDHVPDAAMGHTPFASVQRALAARAGVPTLAVGSFASATEAETALSWPGCELVAMGRALLADPELPAKSLCGKADTVTPCVYCNECWHAVNKGDPLRCAVNPAAGSGRELEAASAARVVKRVAVVGGGIAGLEAAGTAAAHGHRVTLLADGVLGGGLRRVADGLPGRDDLRKLLELRIRQATDSGVLIEAGGPADLDAVLATRPENVVVATGARMVPPSGVTGLSVRDYLTVARPHAGTAVLFDDDQTETTYAVADLLAHNHPSVVLVTRRWQLGRALPHVTFLGVRRRLARAGVRIVYGSRPIREAGGSLVLCDVDTGREQQIDDVSMFVWATPRRSSDGLVYEIMAAGVPVEAVGDAFRPGDLAAAVRQARAVARDLPWCSGPDR